MFHFDMFPQRANTAATAPDIGTTQLAPGFPISDIFKMISNITPFAHTDKAQLTSDYE